MGAKQITDIYIEFFKNKGHVQIPNASLIPENDPTTLFTSSGMQPLVPFLIGEKHPQGKRLVNVQNCFRAQDIDEIGDNRHTTFFRMLGNWSLGDPASPKTARFDASRASRDGYFKSDEIPWLFEFLTKGLNINPAKLYVTVFEGNEKIERDKTSENIWRNLFESEGISSKDRIFYYGVDRNWWSRSGTPERMPIGEPGGPDTEVFYDFETPHDKKYGEKCHLNCECGRYLEIGNSVFMQYIRTKSGFEELPQKNVDFGGGLERLVGVTENQQDIFKTSLFSPIIETIQNTTAKEYSKNQKEMRIIADHLVASVFIIANNVRPSNKEQGYVLRRLLRRAFDNFDLLNGSSIISVAEKIVEQYQDTDEYLVDQFEQIKNVIIEEEQAYTRTRSAAKKFISKKYQKTGDELKGTAKISAEDAFTLYTTHGLSPTQIESLGFMFDRQEFAQKMEEHQKISRAGAEKKFAGGLADHANFTIKGHTATHLLHQALRDVLGDSVHQTGSNITSERVRFDFSFDRKPTEDEIIKLEKIINQKILDNLPVYFEIMPLKKAKEIGAIGLFDDKYQDNVKVYFIGGRPGSPQDAYSKEFCGGPHVHFTNEVKSFKIIREESLGKNTRRIYGVVK